MFELIGSFAAANGAMYLDNVAPGWFEKIDLDTLSLANEKKCVLGQVFGEFFSALDDLELSFQDARELGLLGDDRLLYISEKAFDDHYKGLNAAWRLLIEERVQNALLDRLEASLGLNLWLEAIAA